MNSAPFIIASHELNQLATKLNPDTYAALISVSKWLFSFVGVPNTNLGRAGDVCPFVRPSLTKHFGIYFAPWTSQKPEFTSTLNFLRILAAKFSSLQPISSPERNFKALIAVFPDAKDESVSTLVQALQIFLKPEIVGHGMMIGQFYFDCAEPGLHNLDFRPLQSPYPLLVLRYMQLTDLPFLVEKPEYISQYCSKFNISSLSHLEKRLSGHGVSVLPRDWESCVRSISHSLAS